MGYEKGVQYIHEAMAFPDVEITIMKVMREAIDMLHIMYGVDRARSRAYSDKEVARFSNELLFDPITRVAREPLRKLAQGDRLVGAAALCLQAGVRPDGIFRGIEAACRYTSVLDNDYLTMQYARRMNIHQFLSFIGIRESEPIMQHIKERVASL
jgi:mannitol-1-phosphate/altronate dehydrogenase